MFSAASAASPMAWFTLAMTALLIETLWRCQLPVISHRFVTKVVLCTELGPLDCGKCSDAGAVGQVDQVAPGGRLATSRETRRPRAARLALR
jgi:hypothetical protein